MKKVKVSVKHLLAFAILAVLTLLIEQSLIGMLFQGKLVIHFTPLLILFLAFYWDSLPALIYSWLIGSFVDFSSAVILGPSMLAAALVYFVFNSFADRLYLESTFILLFSGFAASFLFLLSGHFLGGLFLNTHGLSLGSLCYESFCSAIFTPVLFILMRRFFLEEQRI